MLEFPVVIALFPGSASDQVAVNAMRHSRLVRVKVTIVEEHGSLAGRIENVPVATPYRYISTFNG
jgi:hypothetical protein